jgi:Spy/CpxP family protein refolding chaperone
MSMEKGTRTRFATLLILLLVLATGSVLGIAVDRRLQARGYTTERVRGESSRRSRDSSRSDQQADSSSTRSRRGLLVEQVGLSEAQQTQIDSIVAHYRQRMRELQEELEVELRQAYQPRYRGLLEKTRENIKAVLTPEQGAVYDSILADYDRRREDRHGQDSISDSRGQGE